jgi:hypothetical protein
MLDGGAVAVYAWAFSRRRLCSGAASSAGGVSSASGGLVVVGRSMPALDLAIPHPRELRALWWMGDQQI